MNLSPGQRLKAAREERQLSLKDVAHRTRIPVQRLQMLEDDNFAAFGSMAYAKVFLRHYSRYLDVDTREAADGLPRPLLGGATDYRHLTESHGLWVEPREARRWRLPRVPSLSRTSRSPVPVLICLFVIMAVAAGLLAQHLKTLKQTGPEAAETFATSSEETVDAGATAAKDMPASIHAKVNEPLSTAITAQNVQLHPELPVTMMRAIPVAPGGQPAPDSPDTPVRKPEIIK